MGKKVEPPKEELAPAYFVQYSSLWCIMLGFFVMLLSLGNTQMGPGADGIGEVRDAFGKGGGLGLLPYAKNVLFGRPDGGASSFRIRESAPQQLTEIDGYIRGKLWQRGLSNLSMITVMSADNQMKVILQIPVQYDNWDRLDDNTVQLLETFGSVLLDLQDYKFEVMAVESDAGSPEESQRRAMLRAAVITRLLLDVSSLPQDQVAAVGYSDVRYIEAYGMELVKGNVLLSLEKDKTKPDSPKAKRVRLK